MFVNGVQSADSPRHAPNRLDTVFHSWCDLLHEMTQHGR